MEIPDIDFTRIRSLGPGGQRDGYEQFICEQVAQEQPAPDAKFVSLHGAGGDGGVECYWTLADGTEYGWQAKYWTDHSAVDKGQLDKSVKAALEQHPKLAQYTISIPADPTGRTGRKAKSLLAKIQDPKGWLDGWKAMAALRGMSVVFEVEWRTNIVTRLTRLDVSGTQRRYWFDVDVLAERWWDDRKQDAVSAARPRYMPELNIEVPAARAIAALCSDDEWWMVVLSQIETVKEAASSLRYADETVLAADLAAAGDAVARVVDALSAWHASRGTTAIDDLAQVLEESLNSVSDQEALEVAAMDAKYADATWDTPGWRQFQAEYMVCFPAAAVDGLRELGKKLTETSEVLLSPTGRLAGAQVALITGPAGIGKTYLALDSVVRRLGQGRPSVMMHGRWFSDHEPLAHLRGVLSMPPDLSSEDAIALLDQHARVVGATTLLVVDALNDTRPRSLWRDNLERIIATIGRYPHVRLLLTARTHYLAHVLPPGLTVAQFEHTGFEGVEFEAVSEYAAFYGLEPPTSPPIHGEFNNPLYLRLVCEALQATGRSSLEQANMGLDELTKMVLDDANARISDRIDASPSDRVVQRSMHALATALADGGGGPLNRADAQFVLTPIWSDRSAEKSLLDALIAQGLVEEDVISDGSTYGADVVAITFERIGHHLIVSDALSGVTDADGVRAELGSRLGRLIGLGGIVDIGVLEATSVVVAERLGLELTEFGAEIGDDDALATAVIAGIGWRTADSISDETRLIVTNALRRETTRKGALTMLFRLASRAGHGLNGEFLHGLLGRMSLGERDEFLPAWLHRTHGTSGGVDRLIRWAREKPLDLVGADTTRLWVTALLWMAGASDRRVREPATIAAARLLARHPDQAAGLLERFTVVNDEWVVERSLEVAYSALLRSGSTNDWAAAAGVVWNRIFSVPMDVTPNAAVRDAARSILEAANERGALPATVTVAQFRPPYTSDWPPTWPTEADIGSYDNVGYPKLVYSTTSDDFFTYKVSSELKDRPGIDVDAAARWVVQEVIRLGYRSDRHAEFDGYVMRTYGGGRSKPAWVERIGKKYQWIALNRLIGMVSDHVPKTPSSWDPPAPPVPGPVSGRCRQVDPTVLEFPPTDAAERSWVPGYDWAPASGNTDAEWIVDDTDLPTIAVTDAVFDGRQFVVLSGTYDWTNVTDTGKPARRIWIHLVPHLVATPDLPAALGEVEGRDLLGHELSRCPLMPDGYVGEYPYGHHHGESIHVKQHEWREPLGVPTSPAAWDILGEYEYAPGNQHRISLDAPAPEFFGPVPGDLRWNGRNGWSDKNDQIIAVVRHTNNTGQNELLIDAIWLEQWLVGEKKSLIWVESTAKEAFRGLGGKTHPGRLTRSQVHSWAPGRDAQTSAPFWDRLPARGE
ncbi:MAG: hypothetical protein ACRBN8_38975 [Nannocystales bacterium]